MAEGPERIAREEMVKVSLKDLANDHMEQKKILRLEPPPVVSMDVDKGKGIVYNFEQSYKDSTDQKKKEGGDKLFAAAIRSGRAMKKFYMMLTTQSEFSAANFEGLGIYLQKGSTVFRTGLA